MNTILTIKINTEGMPAQEAAKLLRSLAMDLEYLGDYEDMTIYNEKKRQVGCMEMLLESEV